LYIPEESNVIDISSFIRKEIDSANNIKSKTTRKKVHNALGTIERHLKGIKKFPEMGLIVFVGETRKDGFIQEFLKSPIPLKKKIYVCHQTFETEIIKQEINACNNTVIYILINGNECIVYESCGSSDKILWKKIVDLDNEQKKGGQSQARHSRNRDIQKKNYLTICCERVNDIVKKMENVLSIFVAGNGNFKNLFVKYDFHEQVKKKLHITTLEISERNTLKDVQIMAKKFLYKDNIDNELDHLTFMYKLLETEPDLVRFGKVDVNEVICEGIVKTLYINDETNLELYRKTIENVVIISNKTGLSQTFINLFNGYFAVLYYKIIN
jgi:peptide chain release factor 1